MYRLILFCCVLLIFLSGCSSTREFSTRTKRTSRNLFVKGKSLRIKKNNSKKDPIEQKILCKKKLLGNQILTVTPQREKKKEFLSEATNNTESVALTPSLKRPLIKQKASIYSPPKPATPSDSTGSKEEEELRKKQANTKILTTLSLLSVGLFYTIPIGLILSSIILHRNRKGYGTKYSKIVGVLVFVATLLIIIGGISGLIWLVTSSWGG